MVHLKCMLGVKSIGIIIKKKVVSKKSVCRHRCVADIFHS